MAVFIGADYHLGHDNVIKYCDRPFKSGQIMNETIVRNHNQRVSEKDTMYHAGDFCFRGGREGGLTKAALWESRLNGKIIHIIGNHDPNNGVKERIFEAKMYFGKRTFWIKHRPPVTWHEIPLDIDVVLCGHVHEKWDHLILDCDNERPPIPVINVGVDVRNFRPMRLDEVIRIADRLK